MKKKFSLGLVLVMVLAFCLTACGGDKYADSKYVGTWNATVAVASGLEVPVDTIMDEFTIILNADGTATAKVDGDSEDGQWEETEKGVVIDETAELTADGDKLTIEKDGVIIYFEKE